jgi:hypothetical protein
MTTESMSRFRDTTPIIIWCVLTLIIMAFSLVVVISNHDKLSLRVRRKIPGNRFYRWVIFLFYNGAAGGLVWVILIAAATFAITCMVLLLLPELMRFSAMDPGDMNQFVALTGASVLYGLAYGLTGLFIHRQFLSRHSPKLAGVFSILLPALWALLPNLVLFFTNRLDFPTLQAMQLGSVFNAYIVRQPGQRTAHVICAAVWLFVMVILNLRWFTRQLKEFRPLEKFTPAEPRTASVPPPLPTQRSLAS